MGTHFIGKGSIAAVKKVARDLALMPAGIAMSPCSWLTQDRRPTQAPAALGLHAGRPSLETESEKIE